jgi:hypothetical protein
VRGRTAAARRRESWHFRPKAPLAARWLTKAVCCQAQSVPWCRWPTAPIKAVDGPFAEAKELVGGYAVLEVRSKAEAVELTKRLMPDSQGSLAWLGR